MSSAKPLSFWLIGLPCSGKSSLSQGVLPKVTQSGHLQDMRNMARNITGKENYVAPLSVCEKRDIKRINKKTRVEEILQFTGINSPFEPPVNTDVIIRTDYLNIEASIEKIFNLVESKIKSN